jgi:hypothetical protein
VLPVAFEIAVVRGVKSDERNVESPVGFGDAFAAEIAPLSEQCLEIVQRFEELLERLLISLLRLGEAAAIDAVIDRRVDPLVELVDFGSQVGRVKIDGGITPWSSTT